MNCVICKHGETQNGAATVTLERDGMTLVIKGVPAQICANCVEAYIEDTITAHLLQLAEESLKSGVVVNVREFVPVEA